jgi:signal transduction histidine kinase
MVISGLSVSSLILRTGRPLYNERRSDEEAILDEAMDNLRESIQRLRAIQSQLPSTGLDENPNYRDLLHRLRSALAMSEAAFMEARRRAEREGNR